jgi:hypothetical protein
MLKKLLVVPFSVLLVFIITLTAFTPVFAFDGIEINSSLKETGRNTYYSFVGGRLITSFPTALIHDEFGERKIILYPPEYAGGYIDEFNNLHIVLAKDADFMVTKRVYQEIMGNDEDIIYEVADFPLSRLYEVQRTLDKVMYEFDISGTGINEFTNRIDICIEKEREKDVLEFLKTKFDDFDERCITFDGPAELRFAVAVGDTTNLLLLQNQKMLIISSIIILTIIAAATTVILITKMKQK